MEPLYYTYEASEHCTACALARFGRNERGEIDGTDNDGNPVGAGFDFSEAGRSLVCGTCTETIFDAEDEDDDDDDSCEECGRGNDECHTADCEIALKQDADDGDAEARAILGRDEPLDVGDVVFAHGSSAILGDVVSVDVDENQVTVAWRATTTTEVADDLTLAPEASPILDLVRSAVTERDLATILCALRLFQQTPGIGVECEDHFGEETALTNDEIDDLCLRLNDSNYTEAAR
ncbi:MAG: hypothetical protein NVS3B16_24820 [Vulcanimicrobiaceae bacterium]